MKQKIFLLISVCIAAIALSFVRADSPYPNDVSYFNLATGVTNMAASSTNTTAGTAYSLPNTYKGVRIYFSATTYTNVGQLNLYLPTSPDGTLYETPRNTNVKLTLSLTNSAAANGPATNTVQALFDLTGASKIKEAIIENQSGTSISNATIIITYPFDFKEQNR